MSLQDTAATAAQARNFSYNTRQTLDTLQVKDLQPSGSTIFLSALCRLTAVAAGAGLLSASTYAMIEAGHLSGAAAVTPVAVAGAVVVGAAILPRADRWFPAFIIVGLITGEAFNLQSTAERLVIQREARASIVTGTNDNANAAQTRLDAALAARVDYRNRTPIQRTVSVRS